MCFHAGSSGGGWAWWRPSDGEAGEWGSRGRGIHWLAQILGLRISWASYEPYGLETQLPILPQREGCSMRSFHVPLSFKFSGLGTLASSAESEGEALATLRCNTPWWRLELKRYPPSYERWMKRRTRDGIH